MTKSESALAKVQDLYLIQVELWNFLDSASATPEQIAETKARLREFSSLLKQADWHLMGGEDVIQTLQSIQNEVSQKLKAKSGARKTMIVRGSLSSGKPVRGKQTAKSSKKKPATKKKVVKKATKKKRK